MIGTGEFLAGNHYACDLCPKLRPKEARALGVGWIDGFWVCAHCFGAYCRKLVAAGGTVYATRS